MGLISETAIVKWSGSNKKYYELKGYKYTKQLDEFEVKIEDLPNGSHANVQVKCDGKDCNKILNVNWKNYLTYLKKDKTYYCKTCSSKLFGIKNRIKNKLNNNGVSFYDWCYKNLDKDEANKIIDRWDYDFNKCSPKDVLYSSDGFNKKGYWFKCLEHSEHKSELHSINRFTYLYVKNKGTKSIHCSECNSFAQWGIDNIDKKFLEKYWSDKNILNPWEIDKGSDSYTIWIKCQNHKYHKDYKTVCFNFTKGDRCPYCSNRHGKVHPLDSLGKYIIDNYGEEFLNKVWSEKNKKSAFEYSPNSSKKVWWKCPDEKHTNYLRRIFSSTRLEFRCPKCSQERDESILQGKVRLYLENLNNKKYTILHEHDCTVNPINPKTKNILLFDNEIKELKLIIEVHGIQHYNELAGLWLNKNFDLHKRQLYDRYKRIYAKSKGYYYLEIPYWTDNEQKEWETLINNKINEILNEGK